LVPSFTNEEKYQIQKGDWNSQVKRLIYGQNHLQLSLSRMTVVTPKKHNDLKKIRNFLLG
jgi:hypothetical protein